MAGVRAVAIGKSFGTTRVLRDVSLTVEPGAFVSLVGPSGCGKTTLMRIIAGLETATTGQIIIGDRDVTTIRAADRDVAMVFQNYALYPHLTVAQNLMVPLTMRGLTAVERLPLVGRLLPGVREREAAFRAEAERVAGMLAIDHLLARKPAQLSGGQRQRVALGRAIVRKPRVFLMDEPLSNLDAALRVQTRTEIVALHRRVGASTIYVTHDQSEAMTMSDRVAVMMDGELLQIASPRDIYVDPVDLRVAGFIGSPRINTLPAEVAESGDVLVNGEATGVVSPHRGPATLATRPEDLAPAAEGVEVTVTQTEYLGDSMLLHGATVDGALPLIARLAPEEGANLRVGARLRLAANPAKALLFDAKGRRVRAGARQLALLHG